MSKPITCQPAVKAARTSLYSNVCIVGQGRLIPSVHTALIACCGAKNVHEDECYQWCDISTFEDIASWNYCMENNLDLNVYATLDVSCHSDQTPDDTAMTGTVKPSSARTGKIATTWDGPTQKATISFTNSDISSTVVKTQTFSGNPKNSNAPNPELGGDHALPTAPGPAMTGASHSILASGSSVSGTSTTRTTPPSTSSSSTTSGPPPSTTSSSAAAIGVGNTDNTFKFLGLIMMVGLVSCGLVAG
ncbi:hypothetical protein BJ875DRAFT_499077 [Amylocarpus encephaloides]|uniref:Uncharacterized protein n=1 Tax=Amylocarpus encephaloides TaxID=45428 RepID=A0A9P7YB86_9HELO|nr:hypothetical protein BJ875DRAFT_499077 [Amylocarpus encephaloides]